MRPLVDGEPLELVEDRVARRGDRVAPVDAADRDHVDRRRLLLEDVDLRRARLGAQDVRLVEEERVARRAGRVRRQERELVEVVLDRLDLAVVAHLVAEPEERVLDGAAHLGDRVEVAERQLLAGERDVDHLLAQAPVELLAGERASRARRPPPRAVRRTPFRSIPVSRSRTSRSARASSLLRPRYCTRTCSSSSLDAAGCARRDGLLLVLLPVVAHSFSMVDRASVG